MTNPSGGSGKRCVVIGLDGSPYSFLKKEMAAGNLPHLADLTSRGKFGRMETEIPAISSVAWASFMTGENPGMHGIFGFTDRKPGTYDLYFPNYTSLKTQPLWDTLSQEGRKCCVMNVPSTYPARPLNGILVSGFVAPNLERAVYPAPALEYLKSMGYRVDVDAAKGRESLDLFLEDLFDTLEKRREAVLHFWKEELWDLFVFVLTGTDRLHHFMWRHYEDKDPTYYPEFMRYYKRVDEIVGEFISEMPEETLLFMLSDHGSCTIKNEVYGNAFLRERGYLDYTADSPMTTADIDPEKSRAYFMDPGRLYLNREGREPGGIVKVDEAPHLIDDIVAALQELRDPVSGETIVDRIVLRDEIYQGPQADLGPDLVVHPKRGYDFKGSVAQPNIFWNGHLTGMHTQDDAFVFACNPWAQDVPRHIRDVAPLILKAMV
ncbi:MAG: alkaline phosphatase family protein [Thermoleophilia bacterium]